MKRAWILTGALVGAAAIGSVAWQLRGGVAVQVAVAQRGGIREYIDELGKTRVPRVYRVTTPQAGRIAEITLAAGSPVQAGQVVAEILSADLDNAVDEARAAVERLEAAILENDDVAVERSLAVQAAQFVASMNKTVEAAQAQMEASNKRAEYAETKLGRAQQLFASRATAEDELDRANLQYWEGQLGFRQDSLTVEAMNSIRAATALLPQMVADYIAHKGLSRAVLEKQKLEAEARLRQILIERQRGVMRSPVDGLVLQRLIEDEQFLNAGTELLTIGQLDALEVETDILSQDVVRISTGDPVEVYGPAVGGGLGHGVPGTVHQIYPAGFTKISSLGVEQQRVKVVIRLPSDVVQRLQEREVGVDYRVRARIFTAQQDDALLVPRSALFRGPDGQWQLFVIRRNRAVLRRVELGLANDEHAQIVRGLEEGESVILAPETRLTHGTRVTPVP